MPREAFSDKRLTLCHLRVLGALYSFWDAKKQKAVFPSRDAVSDRCGGLHIANVSRVTSDLERFGYLTKTGKGGFSKANHYMLTIPNTLAESTTVDHPNTLAESTTVCAVSTLAESATSTLAESARGKEVNHEVNQRTSGKGKKPRKGKGKKITFAVFLDSCAAKGEKPISTYRAVWEYADRIGLNRDWVDIAWLKFKNRYLTDPNYSGKLYIDWRRAFFNAVDGNWLKLWYANKDGGFSLTTVGQMAELSTREAA